MSYVDRFAPFRNATAAALLRGPGATPAELREAVARGTPPPDLVPLVANIRQHAYTVTDAGPVGGMVRVF